MRVAAHNVKPGDRVRGIGLVAEYVEPETDFHTRIEGYVSHRDSGEKFTTSFVVPNTHVVNVVRGDEAFRNDRIALVQDALDRFNEGANGDEFVSDAFVEELQRIANMPRGAYADYRAVQEVFNGLDGTQSAEEILDLLDADPEPELPGGWDSVTLHQV